MTDTTLEQSAVGSLLRDVDDAAVWAALDRDGWLGLVPEDDGTWPTAAVAASIAGAVARAGRRLPVGAHLAAATTLARAGRAPAVGTRLGVAVDLRPGADGLVGRCWGAEDPDLVVLATAEGTLAVAPGHACDVVPDPMPSFDEVDVRRITVPASALEVVGDAAARQLHEATAACFLAAEALASVQSAIDRTIDHLGKREAFGQPHGAFNALQHRGVDQHSVGLMAGVLLELAGTAWEADREATAASWQAKVFAGTRGVWAAEEAIQLHGAIGFTWELGLHHALRRAQRARLLMGGPARAAAEVVAASRTEPRPGLVDWTLRPVPRHP
ncbi:MAG: putative acyl-CoA dehydrogenase [Blastococcus sp.]|nr:putative acyl-CoA dehydrogenase [Blastococcus sp.]